MGGTKQPLARLDSPKAQLDSLIGKLNANDQTITRAARSAMRKRLPTANELVYEYTDAVVIGYAPNEQPIDGSIAIKAMVNDVRLYFLQGAALPDPAKLLEGSARNARFVRLKTSRMIAQPAVKAMIDAAIKQARIPFPVSGGGQLIIRSIGGKRRPRTKTAT